MEEQIVPNEPVEELVVKDKKRGRYGLLIRMTALILVVAIVLNIVHIDFSLLKYQGTDQMVAAQYLMDSTSYLGQSRLQRLKSLLDNADLFSINLQAAEIAIGKTDYERAAKFLNKCIPLCQDTLQTAELYNRLGCVYMLAGDPAQAQQAFDSSIELNSKEATPYLLRAQLRYQSGDTSGAAQDAAVYLEMGGNDDEMLSTAASICELGGDLENAVKALSRKIYAAPNDTAKARAHAERGRVQYLMGREMEACADIALAKKLNVGVLTGVHYAIVALCEYNSGDYLKGREDFLQAARLSEDGNAEYYEQAILCGYLSEDYDFIKKAVEEAREEGMMTASSLLIEGILLFSEEDYEDAEASLTESIETGKIVVGSYYYRGLSRLAIGEYEKAAEDFTESVKWEQDKVGCIFNRGVCYYGIGEDEKAREDFQYVIDNSTDETLKNSAEELLAVMESEK